MIAEPKVHANRAKTRQRSLLRGKVLFNRGQSTVDCVIRDISDGGARLEVSGVSLPAFFELEIPDRGQTRRAHLRWAREGGVGVQFARDARETAAPGDAAGRVGDLEVENSRLQKLVAALRLELVALRGD